MKKDVFWNAAGSLIYALASMVLAFVVIKLVGDDEGGIFGFGFSTLGQQMFIIAYFGIRPFQITDTGREYRFSAYLSVRWLTCFAAFVSALLYLAVKGLGGSYTLHKTVVLALLCLYKILDGFADVYESELQRTGYLYRTGQSLAFRTLLSVFVLIFVLILSKNLVLASLAACAAQLVGICFFAIKPLQAAEKLNAEKEKKNQAEASARQADTKKSRRIGEQIMGLLRSTALLFVSVFLDFYVFSAAKYAVDAQMSNAASGFFNILFMPTSFIYLLANFMIRPMLTRLAEQYQAGEQARFEKTCRTMLLGVSGLGAVIVLGALVLGRWGLSIFELLLGSAYAGRLTGELLAFLLIIAGGAFYALANVQYYVLVTMRCQNLIFLGYAASAVLAWLLAPRMVAAGGMFGAGLCYLLLMALLFLVFTAAVRWRKRGAFAGA